MNKLHHVSRKKTQRQDVIDNNLKDSFEDLNDKLLLINVLKSIFLIEY
jgi:hypothetical protein